MVKIIRQKRFWGLLAVGILVPTCCWQSLSLLWNPDALTLFLKQAGPWRPLIFIAAHTLATAIGIPGTILVIVGGAVFGLVWGTFWSVIGATLGAVVAFCLARYLFHDWFKHRFSRHPRFRGLNQMMQHQGLHCVMTIRFAPISPFNIVNFLCGLTAVDIRPYTVGTLIGIIPGTLVYTWLGVTGMQALHGEGIIPLLVCLGLLALLSALPILMKRFQRV